VEAVAVERSDEAGLVQVKVEERHEQSSRLSTTKFQETFNKVNNVPPNPLYAYAISRPDDKTIDRSSDKGNEKRSEQNLERMAASNDDAPIVV
jgi:hypothetical protein